MRRRFITVLILLIFTSSICISEKTPFTVRPAKKYPTKQRKGDIILAVKPYHTPKETKIAFGQAIPYAYGILPILMVLQNDSDHALNLQNLQVRVITPDREGIEPLVETELQSSQLRNNIPSLNSNSKSERSQRTSSIGPEVIRLIRQAFKAPIVPPQSTVSGFFYYATKLARKIVEGGTVYVSGVQNLTTGKELPYFEIRLQK